MSRPINNGRLCDRFGFFAFRGTGLNGPSLRVSVWSLASTRRRDCWLGPTVQSPYHFTEQGTPMGQSDMQLVFSREELLSDHDYARPHAIDGQRLHGGYDTEGNYIPPRSLGRSRAIANWTESLRPPWRRPTRRRFLASVGPSRAESRTAEPLGSQGPRSLLLERPHHYRQDRRPGADDLRHAAAQAPAPVRGGTSPALRSATCTRA